MSTEPSQDRSSTTLRMQIASEDSRKNADIAANSGESCRIAGIFASPERRLRTEIQRAAGFLPNTTLALEPAVRRLYRHHDLASGGEPAFLRVNETGASGSVAAQVEHEPCRFLCLGRRAKSAIRPTFVRASKAVASTQAIGIPTSFPLGNGVCHVSRPHRQETRKPHLIRSIRPENENDRSLLQPFKLSPSGFRSLACQRLENWKLRRAFRFPYFFRSTTLASLVRKPADFNAGR